MTGWLIYSKLDIQKNSRYINFYIEEGKLLDIDIRLILIEDLEFGIKDNTWFMNLFDQPITIPDYPDFVICRTIYPLLSKQFESMGIRVFNNSVVAEICNDKAKTYQYVAKLEITMVDSSFCRNDFLKQRLKDMVDIKDPKVIKAVAGHGGSQVFLLNTDSAKDVEQYSLDILEQMDNADAVIQPLTGTKHQDLRVYVIGKQIIAAILRTAKEGFKSNFSLGGEVRKYELSQAEINIVMKIVNHFDFDLVGIDFIIGDQGELIFNEIEDVVGARMLYQCTDINLVQLYLNYIKRQVINNNLNSNRSEYAYLKF
jgi:gamma-F420-2:alpha-L-glutamate ligase